MKQSDLEMLGDAQKKEDGHAKMFIYRCCCLPVKTNALQLLGVKVPPENKNLEDVCDASQLDEKHFLLIPRDDSEEMVQCILMGMKQSQPLMKTEVEEEDTGVEGVEKMKRIRCTVPEVDEDTKDILEKIVDADYNAAKAKIELVNVPSLAKSGGSKEVIDELNTIRENSIKQCDDMREKMMKDIQDRYNEYLQKQKAKEDASKKKS
ncbi:MAG TPA: hypothetical protein DDY68_01745 [Porphyromonadaceae bacterium]|nr:hypothetical protein [Porphyromonadaceae bacterium]